MPQLPIYTAQRNIEARPAATLRDEAAIPFQLQQQVTGVLSEISARMAESKNVMQYTEAKAKYEVATADIQARAAQDPDFNNSESYLKELQEAKKNSLMGVKNRNYANKAALEFDYGGQIAAIKINAGFHSKQLDYNRKSLSTGVNTLMQKSMAADTMAERATTQLAIDDLVQLNVANGTITDFEAQELVYEAKKNVAMFDAQYNPDKFLANKKEYGLNTSDMAQMNKLAENNKKSMDDDAKALKEQAKSENAINFTKNFLEGEIEKLDVGKIDQMIRDEQIPEDFGRALIYAKTTSKMKKKDINKDKLMKTVDSLLKVDSDDGVINFLTSALNQTGETRQKELDSIMRMAVQHMGENKRGLIQNVIQGIKTMHEYSPAGLAVKGIMNFIENINNGDDPNNAKKKADYDTAMEHNPSMINISDNGTIMQDPVTGVRKRVFKDGRIEDVK